MIINLLSILLSIFSVIGYNLDLNKNLGFLESLHGNELSYIMIAIGFAFIIHKAILIKNKRLSIIAITVSIIFSSFEVVGYSIVAYGDMSGIITNTTTLLKSTVKFLYYIVMIYSIIKVVFQYLKNMKKETNIKEKPFFTNNKRSILIVLGIILLLWLPYFLNYYPGIIEFDTREQILEAVGEHRLVNGNPICTTLMIRLLITMTRPLFNNLTVSIAICVFLKMIFMAFVMSYSIYYLAEKGVSIKVRLMLLIFYAINPIFVLYSISLDKDSLFAIILLMDFILLFDFVTNTETFVKSKFKTIMAFIFILLTLLVRHNGLYIYVLTIPFLYIVLRKKYIKLSIFIVSTLICVNLINHILFAIYDVPEGSSEGLLCVPMQAMSRLVKYNDNSLTEKEKEEIDLFVKYDKLSDSYNPNLSDPEMVNFRVSYLQDHKFDYLKLNLKLFFKYPHYYIESILCNTSGYWFLEDRIIITGWGVMENTLGIEQKNLIGDNGIMSIAGSLIEHKNEIPILGMIFSAGISLWVLILLVFYIVYNKKYKLIITLLPLIINYLIILAGPSNRQFRYILPMYLPLAIICCAISNNIRNEIKNDINN